MQPMAGTPPEANQFSYETSLWANGKNSYGTTVPSEILALRGVRVDRAKLNWSINQETGNVVVEFNEGDPSAE